MDDNEFMTALSSDKELYKLGNALRILNRKLMDYTRQKYGRINPFSEALTDWKEKGRFVGGNNVTIYDTAIITGEMQIGDNTWIGPFTSLDGSGGLRIGGNCSISSGVRILTHDTVKWALSGGKQDYEYSPVTIGDSCFIGVNTIILRGTSIGNHCLIGACSLVNQDIPDGSIVVGSPAKIIGRVEIDGDEVNLVYNSKNIKNQIL